MSKSAVDKVAQAARHLEHARYDAAAALLRPHVTKNPADAAATGALCFALRGLGQAHQAVYYAERALAALPGHPRLAETLSQALVDSGRRADAERVCRDALALHPQDPALTAQLATILVAREQYQEAADLCDRAISEGWGDDALRHMRSSSVADMGLVDEAIRVHRATQWSSPVSLTGAESLASLINYSPSATPEQVRAAQARYAMLVNDVVSGSLPPPPKPVDPERPLRVGVLSPDFRRHSVAFFAQPLVEALASAYHVTCYHVDPRTDSVTERFRSIASAFRPMGGVGQGQIARTIRDDQIDVLFELAGLTAGHAMPALSLRPAPVQCTAIGYPSTTGVRAIDYRLVDSLTDPPGSEHLCVERLWRLDPCFLCYRPPDDAPDPGPAPPVASSPSRSICFGSFNKLIKMNDDTLRLWARVLDAVPGSRLLTKSFGGIGSATRAAVEKRFAAAGIAPDRLTMLPWVASMPEHLATYRQVDLSLDTFPYHGTTTTCESLLMGVPVVSRVGDRHASRVSASLLHAVGLSDLVTQSDDQFVDAAVRLARDTERLTDLRTTLRGTLLRSPLGSQPDYADRVVDAVRQMWRGACKA